MFAIWMSNAMLDLQTDVTKCKGWGFFLSKIALFLWIFKPTLFHIGGSNFMQWLLNVKRKTALRGGT